MTIVEAVTDAQILSCFSAMPQLRPKLATGEFVALMRRLENLNGFRLAYLDDGGVRAVAGYRVSEWPAGGRYLEIEDRVTDSNGRSKGYGGRLFDWLLDAARRERCAHVRLVSNVKREDAHRFYVRKGMELQAHYSSMKITA